MTTPAPVLRRVVRTAAALAIAGAALVGLSDTAGADSTVSSVVTAEACTGGTVERGVTVTFSTGASFTTGVRIHVVSGTPGGPIIDTVTRELQGPVTVTIPLSLPPGTYYFDWEDRSGDGVTWSGRHSGLGSFYEGIYLNTRTEVVPCGVVDETTTTAPTESTDTTTTTTTTSTTTTTPPDVTPFAPPPTASTSTSTTTTSSTTTTVATTSTSVPPPPSPPQTAGTTAPPPGELVVVGGNPVPMLLAGSGFLALGTIALVAARRIPSRPT